MSRGLLWWVIGVVAILAGGAVAGYVVAVVPQQREANRDAAAARAANDLAAEWQGADAAALDDALDYTALTTGLASLVPAADTTDDDAPQPVWPESVEVTEVTREDESSRATATLQVTWPFGTDGWTYGSSLSLEQTDPAEAGGITSAFDTDGGTWLPDVTESVVHPDLVEGAVLAAEREAPTRGDVVGRDGDPLVVERPVVDIGLQPSQVTDLAGTARTFGDTLGIDPVALTERVEAAGPDDFVPVLTMRREAYEPVRDVVRDQPGVVFREGTLPLPPTTEFARATLGRSGQATAEIIDASDGRVTAGDVTGLSGLQRSYDEHLAGQAGFSVVSRVGEQSTGLFSQPPTDGADLALTLDERVQIAADQALASASAGNGNAALVAIDVPTGDLLAVANTPATGTDRALTGTYPPGSTFKSVSTLALLPTGLTADEVVACPQTATIEGRAFRNVEDGQLGDVPFRTDFAQSCNTAFVGLSSRLEPGDLGAAAAAVGLGGSWGVGTDVATGSVPEEESDVEKAAATIGQGRVLASPAAMAQVAATIAGGGWTAPRLVLQPEPDAVEPPPEVDPAASETVRELMRGVVTDGSAAALADVPGAPVHAKTGTAEYGTDDPPRTHAWVIGFQGDLAFAVLVEDGGRGSVAAVPVAETFLRLLQ